LIHRTPLRHTRQALLLCVAALAAMAHAAPPPAEVFYGAADIREAVLSPSGRYLAVTSGKGQPFVGLITIDLSPGGKPVRIAQMMDGDVVSVTWINDDRLLFRMVDMADGSGRQYAAPGLFAVNADGGQFRTLVNRTSTPFLADGSQTRSTAAARILEWNHRLLRVPNPRPGETNEEVLIAQFTKDDHGYETPMWLNTTSGRTRYAKVDAPTDTVDWLTDPRGEPRVAFTYRENRQAAYWRAPNSAQWELLYESTLLERPFTPVGVDEAGNLYVTEPQGSTGTRVLKRYDFARHAPAEKPIVVTPGFDFEGSLITDGGGNALGVRVDIDAELAIWFDPAMKALQDQVDAMLPGRVNRIQCRRCGQADMVALLRSYSDRDPGQLLVYKAKPPEGEPPWRLVGRVREDIKPEQMARTSFHRIKARDGLDLPVWVTRPADAKGPLPAVVLVHGGPWVRGRTWGWDPDAQFLATRGYAVIEPEMRGSTGYGDAHFTAGFRQFGQAMQDDVTDALRWAQGQGLAGDKACIAGASYGGYSTLMGLVRDPELYRCGVAWMALADLDLLLTGSARVIDDVGSASRKYTLPEMIGDPRKDAEMIARYSPVKQAAAIKAPVMLAYGEDDKRVPIEHGERMRDALKAAGHPPVWITYAGEAHGFGMSKNRTDFAERMAAFLAKYLGPAQTASAQP
jgi:dipeptidyl aminopeptidase/acylaminoacyl peptidase